MDNVHGLADYHRQVGTDITQFFITRNWASYWPADSQLKTSCRFCWSEEHFRELLRDFQKETSL